jgi:lauroyl/myristoyl acyltransferase
MRLKERFLYILLYAFSLLPMQVLYLLSNLFAFVAFSGLGYRKEIVMANLSIAFPEKSDREIKNFQSDKIKKAENRKSFVNFIENQETILQNYHILGNKKFNILFYIYEINKSKILYSDKSTRSRKY